MTYHYSAQVNWPMHGVGTVDICGTMRPTTSNVTPLGPSCMLSKGTDGSGTLTKNAGPKGPKTFQLTRLRWKTSIPVVTTASPGQTLPILGDYTAPGSAGTVVMLLQTAAGLLPCVTDTAQQFTVVGSIHIIPGVTLDENTRPLLCKRTGDLTCLYGSK